jgi:hypothetical protein
VLWRAASPWAYNTQPAGIQAFDSGRSALAPGDNLGQSEAEKQRAQDNRYPEQNSLDATSCSEHAACIRSGQAPKAGALALQNHAQDQPNRHYNQRSIEKYYHALASTGLDHELYLPPCEVVNQCLWQIPVNEIVLNLHMHTRYSDGSGSHRDLARAALRQSIDAILVTDHNVRVQAMQRYYEEGGQRVLILAGEEVHDRTRLPQKDHLLVFGVDRELAALGEDLRSLTTAVKRAGGISFLAHPVDPAAPAFHEPDISWEAGFEQAFTGLELWNGFSELKAHIPSRLHGIFYAFFPALMPRGPLPATMQLWEKLLAQRPTVAIGGSDAHALKLKMGALHRTVFPYDFHFRSVNTHVLLDRPLSGDADADAKLIYGSLAAGRCFIGYDLPRSTKGFRFVAHGKGSETPMGAHMLFEGGATIEAWAPDSCEFRLLRNGIPVSTISRGQALAHRILERGVYRLEAYRGFWAQRRTWILSNPIYVQ